MDAVTETSNAIRKARGRKDGGGQEAVISTKPLKDKLRELEELKKKSDAAKDRLNDAIKAIAEQAGLLASVVRKLVNARSGDNYEQEARKVEQLGIVFDEIGND